MSKFHKLKISDIRRETPDAVSIAFEVPGELRSEYGFNQGQYLTLRATINGEEVRRSYSICSARGEAPRVAIKRVNGGLFSNFANDVLKAGDELDVMPPMGKFYVPIDPAASRHYMLFASGSGITPIISIVKTVLREEPQSRVTLLYGNRSFSSIIFRDELEDLKDRYLGRLRLFHVLSREKSELDLFSGRIDASKCDSFFSALADLSDFDEFFICGPEPMILSVQEFLESKNIPREKVHFELFTSPLGSLWKDSPAPEVAEADREKVSKVRIILDGTATEIELKYGGKSILDAALEAGADLPYSCKGGVCRTCMAKLENGQVRMDANWALEPGEVESGYILTCQSHPTSSECSVNYDVSG